MSYWTNNTTADTYENAGPSGKYYGAVKIAATETLLCTGANNGMAAVILGSGANVAGTKIHLQGGGIIDGNDLLPLTIYEFAVQKVVAVTGDVYVLRKKGL
tara:strand:+ start:1401 stop:1703 length:303 start_codon:yes stop_codon:yes gene_type:complete